MPSYAVYVDVRFFGIFSFSGIYKGETIFAFSENPKIASAEKTWGKLAIKKMYGGSHLAPTSGRPGSILLLN